MKNKKKKKMNWKNIVALFLLTTLILSIIYIIIRIIIAPTEVASVDSHTKVKSDYMLMLLQCALGIVVMRIPHIVEKRKSIDIPDTMEIIYFIFLYCAIFLGEVQNFYYLIPFWDTILHAFSGLMLGAIGIILVRFFNDVEHVKIELSPIFIAFFAFCFGVTAGTLWEVYEFIADGLFSLNMQKFALSEGSQLVGREALSDTMLDLIVDTASVLIISFIGYVSLHKNKKRRLL